MPISAPAQETLRLSQQRKEFAVGIVLEVIQAEQELTEARLDYVTAVGEFNKAQYGLSWAVGSASTEGKGFDFNETHRP
jgi:outer membrane protein TolC